MVFLWFKSKAEKQNAEREKILTLLDNEYDPRDIATMLKIPIQRVVAYMKGRKKKRKTVSEGQETITDDEEYSEIEEKKIELELTKLEIQKKKLESELKGEDKYLDNTIKQIRLEADVRLLEEQKKRLEEELRDLEYDIEKMEEEAERLGLELGGGDTVQDPVSQFLAGLLSVSQKPIQDQQAPQAKQTTLSPQQSTEPFKIKDIEAQAHFVLDHLPPKQKEFAKKNPAKAKEIAKQWGVPDTVINKALELLQSGS